MMREQPRGGHIFNIDGAGSDGRPTPRYCLTRSTLMAYGFMTGFMLAIIHIFLMLLVLY